MLIGFIIGVIVGANLGIVMAALCCAAGKRTPKP